MELGYLGYIVFKGIENMMDGEFRILKENEIGITAKNINTAQTYFIPNNSILYIRLIEEKK